MNRHGRSLQVAGGSGSIAARSVPKDDFLVDIMSHTVEDIESFFGISLSQLHRCMLLDTKHPIHDHKSLLMPEGNECQSIFSVNELMQSLDWKQWPKYLVAFATNECGDYFAFDIRSEPYRIYYIDPNDTVPESIESNEREGFVFEGFDHWYEYVMSQSSKESSNACIPPSS